jgi:hypothetical protein
MPKAAFLIPASPTRAFLAQVAAFSLALSRRGWHHWEPSLHVCMGGEVDTEAFRDWLPHMRDVATVFVPAAVSDATPWYYAQIDALYRWAPREADVLVRMDADTLPVGDIEDLLDYVAEKNCIAGVIGHFPFPVWPGTTSRAAWLRIAQGLIERPLDFAHVYSLTSPDVGADERATPFYVNDGAVFFPRAVFDRFSERYLALRASLMDRLPDPYYSGQVALALAAADIGARTCALPMRYNFPNDELAAHRYPEELENVKIFHYLRTEAFDRHRVFLDSANYAAFMQSSLSGVNQVFQNHVKRIFGEAYPFETAPPRPREPNGFASAGLHDPLSRGIYEDLIAAHDRQIAPALQHVDAAIRALEDYQSLKAEGPAGVGLETPAPLLALDYAAQFDASGRTALEPLMRFKQALVEALGVERGFAVYRERLILPDSGRIRHLPLASQYAFASVHGEVFVETAPGGEPFTIEPPTVIGDGVRRPLRHVSRSLYVARLRDARLRGRSAVIETGSLALLDYQGSERELFDCELDIDPAIFHATDDLAWILAPLDDEAAMDIEEAFMLLGPQSGAFGDWMVDYLPRYVAANLSGLPPSIPVLIDASLPEVNRQSLELMLPYGTGLIEIPAYTTARVGRLWCAPSLHYAPTREKMDWRFKFDYLVPPPERFARVTREIALRAQSAAGEDVGPAKIFLARRKSHWRNLMNHPEIETAAEAHGFLIVSPEDLSFPNQVNLLRNAQYVIAPEGSAIYLLYFARPGTKLCVLNHTLVEWPTAYCSLLAGPAPQITILTGPVVQSHPDFPHRADYRIDREHFCRFLDHWLVDKS